VLSPIVHILRNIRKINATNLSLRLKEKDGNDELSELSRMFNQMLERFENSFALQKNFISNASHELKNPLTAIMGETEIALSKPRTAGEYISALQKIETEADRLNELVRNLLSLAQADSDLSAMALEEISINELLAEIKDHFNKTDYQGRIVLTLPRLQAVITGNRNLLRVAIINLIDNACKFSGKQQVSVSLKTSKELIEIEISDTGSGIPDNELKNLFQPFFRASNALSEKGYGIGLSLAQRIIKLHNGDIAIGSELEKGTTVKVNFHLQNTAS